MSRAFWLSALWSLAGIASAQTLEINGEVFRDPTQPPGAVLVEAAVGSFDAAPRFNAANYRLGFIRSGGINPVAVINNRTVTLGDEIERGIRVSDIRAGVVVLDVDGQEYSLNLYSNPVRQSVQ